MGSLSCRSREPEEEDSPESKKTVLASPPLNAGSAANHKQLSNGDLSPEQLLRMEKKKVEAEARLLAKKLGASSIGVSWMQAFQSEFRKGYIEKVYYSQHRLPRSILFLHPS